MNAIDLLGPRIEKRLRDGLSGLPYIIHPEDFVRYGCMVSISSGGRSRSAFLHFKPLEDAFEHDDYVTIDTQVDNVIRDLTYQYEAY